MSQSRIEELCDKLQKEDFRHWKALKRIRRDEIIFKIILVLTILFFIGSVICTASRIR